MKEVTISDCGIIEKSNWVDANGKPEVPTADVVSMKKAHDLEEAWELSDSPDSAGSDENADYMK